MCVWCGVQVHDAILAAMGRYARANAALVARTMSCQVFLDALRRRYWFEPAPGTVPRSVPLTKVRPVASSRCQCWLMVAAMVALTSVGVVPRRLCV